MSRPSPKDAVLARAQAKPKTLIEQLEELKPQMARIIPTGMSTDRMARLVINEVRKTPKLGQCNPASFFGAVMAATQLGLEPGPLGHCYLIPFKDEVTLQIGYKGLLELVNRSGKVDSVYAVAVYESDIFDYELGLNPDIKHKPCGDTDPKRLTYVYAVARIKGMSQPRIEVMSRMEVDGIRKRSQSASSGRSTPWDTDYAEMAKKTVLKRLCKTLPLASQDHLAISADETVRYADIRGEKLEMSNPVHMLELPDEPEKPQAMIPQDVDVKTGEIKDNPSADSLFEEGK
jgi:recombination protein RecT